MAAAPGAGVGRAQGTRAGRDSVEGARPDRDSRGVRGPGALEPAGVRGQGVGDERGHHQRDGRLERDRAPVRCDGRAHRDHARERDEAARRAARAPLDLRPGWDGLCDGPRAPLMAGSLTWEVADGIAVVTFDLPGEPVNKITQAVKEEFIATFEPLGRDPEVKAVAFFSGKRDAFIAGADIEEFVAITTAAEAERLSGGGQAMLGRVARFAKPVAVGIHGACLGGGLEFALACHYRVATDHPKTVLGLPEVQLGLLPGAGGCNRLPRLIGARAALDLILAGKSERAAKALELGLVDELGPFSILQDVAAKAAERLARGDTVRRGVRDGLQGVLLDRNPVGRLLVYRAARAQVLKRTGGHYPAPLAALDVVRVGLERGIERGLRYEARRFGELAVSQVSRNLVQVFFATTALKKDDGVAPGTATPREIRRLGVVGSGFMGSGIAGTAVTAAEVEVRLKDADLVRVGRGLKATLAIVQGQLVRRRITKYQYQRLTGLLSGSGDYRGFDK